MAGITITGNGVLQMPGTHHHHLWVLTDQKLVHLRGLSHVKIVLHVWESRTSVLPQHIDKRDDCPVEVKMPSWPFRSQRHPCSSPSCGSVPSSSGCIPTSVELISSDRVQFLPVSQLAQQDLLHLLTISISGCLLQKGLNPSHTPR